MRSVMMFSIVSRRASRSTARIPGDEQHIARVVVRVPDLRGNSTAHSDISRPLFLDQHPIKGAPRRIGAVLWLAGVRVDGPLSGRRIGPFRQRHIGQQLGLLQLLGGSGAVVSASAISFAVIAAASPVLFGSAMVAAALVRLLAAIMSKLGAFFSKASTRFRSPRSPSRAARSPVEAPRPFDRSAFVRIDCYSHQPDRDQG
jgi:hypothetical protein